MNIQQNYSYQKLQEKYNYFTNPTIQIHVSGKVLPEEYITDELELELTTQLTVTGSARFIVTNKDDSNVLGKLPLMAQVKIEMGYNGKNETVFEGIIFERILKITKVFYKTVTITCLDLKTLFRMNNPFRTYPSVSNLSSVVRQIISRYQLHATIDTSPEFSKPATITQYGISDFDYIVQMAAETGFEFFLLNQEVFFRKPRSIKGIMITFEQGSFFQFEHRTSLDRLATGITIEGHNLDKKQEQTFSCKSVEDKVGLGTTGVAILKKHGKDFTIYESVYMNNHTAKDLKEVAKVRLQENSMLLTEVKIRVNGLPEMIPGRYIKINNVAKEIDNTYYVEKVHHRIVKNQNKNWYFTEIICYSNTINESVK